VENVRLKSGLAVDIRALEPTDGPALNAAYERLSDETKYKRFMAAKPHIGVARFVRLPEDPEIAEFAIVIGDPYQGDGLGSALMSRLAQAATGHGVKRLRGTMLAENIGAHKLTRRLAGELAHERRFGSVDELEIELAA
jgi:GNAT superfamily N-acetyltransferase